jgi:hypothetical protein
VGRADASRTSSSPSSCISEVHAPEDGWSSNRRRVDLDEFKRGIDPIASAGKLGAARAVSSELQSDAASLGYLNWLLDAFRGGFNVAVELSASQLERCVR